MIFNFKRLVAIILTIMMVIVVMPMSVFATEGTTAGSNIEIINEGGEPAAESQSEATEQPIVITYNGGTGITIGTDENSTLSEALDWFYTLMSMSTTEVYSLEITINGDITDTAVAELKYDTTISGTGKLTNVQLNAVEGCDSLTVSGLTFEGNSWINSGSAETLVVSDVTANVTPVNGNGTANNMTNSRSAFISLGSNEAQKLDLTVENCDISVKSNGANPILGWAAITKATITENTIDSQSGYTAYSDSIKFMSIADGASLNFVGNTIYSDYNGVALGQNTTRNNSYTANFDGNTFIGGADHVWIEVSGSNTCNGNVNVTSSNTVNGNAFTKNDIKVHPNLNTYTGYMGVDVELDNGKVIGGTLAYYSEDVIADGYKLDENGNVVADAPAGLTGSGTETDPYKIGTAEEMFLFAEKVNDGTYKNVYAVLTADIDLEQEDWTSIGTSANPFIGTFDGAGYTISNIWSYDRGLFGYTSTGNYVDSGTNGRATIKDLTLNGVEVYNQSTFAVGGLVGQAGQNTEISGVTITGYISIYGYGYVGGVVGQGYVHIDDCHVIGVNDEDDDKSTIDASYWAVAGIVGHAGSESGASITNCSVKNVVIHSAIYGAGSIAGVGTKGPIENVSAENVNIVAESSPDANGVLVGCNYNEITGNCTVKDVVLEVAGATVTAPQDVSAAIGGTYYVTLQAAIDAVKNGDTIKLIKNCTLDKAIVNSKKITLDLGGKTITYNSTTMGEAMITNKGELTINDSVGTGVINYNYTGAADSSYGKGNYTICNAGTLTVNGGKITIAKLSGHAKYPIDNNSTTGDAILVINGGHLYNYNTSAIRMFCNSTTYKNSVTINGGLVEGYGAIWMQNPGSKTVNGSLSITGGEIRTTAKAYVEGTAELKDVKSMMYTSSQGGAWSEDSAISITGGTFNENVNLYYDAPANVTVDEENATFNGNLWLPYVFDGVNIYSLEDLKAFRDAVNAGDNYSGKTVTLHVDIDLASEEWTPIGTSAKPFNGIFDGQNHKISNLVINGGSTSDQGFFGRTNDGEIKNLTFENAKVSGRLSVGVVAGTPYTSKYTNIKVTGHVEVNGMAYVGGVGGRNAYADWTNITVDVDETSYVKADSVENNNAYRTYVGGVIGFNGEGGHKFTNITSNINVIGTVIDVGGIFGIAHYSNVIENVTCTANVTNTGDEEGPETGGIAGVWHNEKGYTVTMNNVKFTGKVTINNVDVTNECSIVGGAYNPDNNTAENSGSLKIDGNEAWLKVPVAEVNGVKYVDIAEALAAVKANDEIKLLADIDADITVPANVIFNGNGFAVNGTITAGGNITFAGVTKATLLSIKYTNSTVTIGSGASLQLTGTDRIVVGYDCTFDIKGNIADAKSANKADVVPSFVVPGGISITGGTGVTFKVENAYVSFGNTSSKNSAANGTFNMDFTNSIVEFTNQFTLATPKYDTLNPVFNVNFKNSVVTTATKMCFAATGSNVVVDNSNVTIATYLHNSGAITVKNGSTFTGSMIQYGENGGNSGTITVDNASFTIKNNNSAYAMDGKDTGKLVLTNGSIASVDYIKATAIELSIDSKLITKSTDLTITTAPGYEANYENGEYTVVKAPAAKIGETKYETLEAALAAAQDGDTVVLLNDIELTETAKVEKAITIDVNDKEITGSGIELAVVGSSVIGPEGLTVTSGVDGYEVKYADGKYSLVEKVESVSVVFANAGHNLRLQDLIKIGFYFTATTTEGKTITEAGAYIWAEGEEESSASKIVATLDSKGKYIVEGNGIRAQELDTLYYARYYVVIDGHEYKVEIPDDYAATEYLEWQYKNTTDSSLKAIVKDLANYATMAQTYFALDIGAEVPEKLINFFMTDADKVLKWSDDLKRSNPTVTKQTAGGYTTTWGGANVNLIDALSLSFIVNNTDVEGVIYWTQKDYDANDILSYDTKSGEGTIRVGMSGGKNSTFGTVPGLYSFNIYDNYYAAMYKKDGDSYLYSAVYGRSIASYASYWVDYYASATAEKDIALRELCKAMLIYGNNAETYFD